MTKYSLSKMAMGLDDSVMDHACTQVPSFQESLKWLHTPIQYAKGVGPRMSELFKKLEILNFENLLNHLPSRYLDRRNLETVHEVCEGKNKCIIGEVYAAGEVKMPGKGRRRLFEVILKDERSYVVAKWFHFSASYLKRNFKIGEKVILIGELRRFRGEPQMFHPEVHALQDFSEDLGKATFLGIHPVYPSTEGLTQNRIRQAIQSVLQQLPRYTLETLPTWLKKGYQLKELSHCWQQLHQPDSKEFSTNFESARSPFHRRLIFEEFFYLNLGMEIKKRQYQIRPGVAHLPKFRFRDQLLRNLPFELTKSQRVAIERITKKMIQSEPMNCLLQGDVGSGKTIVGLMAALLALENRFQVALMVPTEILAEQHYRYFQETLNPFGLKVKLLTHSTKSADRMALLKVLSNQEPALVIGTHALIEEEVGFGNLSLVIIDEQHRFGVRQRMNLMKKARQPDVLVMTATPIPRSLALTLYGDLDICLIKELPKNRKPILTKIMYEKNRSKLYPFIEKKLAQGQQAYFVFPLIEESEKLDLKDATQAFERLQKQFSQFRVGLLHGRMKAEEKDQMMNDFVEAKIKILVATTVIEVGIDVPNATLMVIEHAERFGLSQLHQLRGRVGRGSQKSYCILAVHPRQSNLAKQRLKVMELNHSGFKIAEEDLKLRGPGDFLGTRQSGMPDLRFGNLLTDLDILEESRNAVEELLNRDPGLKSSEHLRIRQSFEQKWKGRLSLAKVG